MNQQDTDSPGTFQQAAADELQSQLQSLRHPDHADGINPLRYLYDAAVEYLQEHNCFTNATSKRRCIFESYMTIIDLGKVAAAIDALALPREDYVRVVAAFAECPFTPLAPVLGTLLSARMKRILA